MQPVHLQFDNSNSMHKKEYRKNIKLNKYLLVSLTTDANVIMYLFTCFLVNNMG